MSDHIDTLEEPRRVQVTHLVFGLVFLGLVAVWGLAVTDVITTDRLAVLGPGVLILAGVIGLAASLAGSRNRRHDRAARSHDASPYSGHDDVHETHDPTDTQVIETHEETR